MYSSTKMLSVALFSILFAVSSSAAQSTEIVLDQQSSNTIYLQPTLLPALGNAKASVDPVKTARDFLGSFKSTLGLSASRDALLLDNNETDSYGYHHIRFTQSHAKMPVVGANTVVHIRPDGVVMGASTNLSPGIQVDRLPRVNSKQAEKIARGIWFEENGKTRPVLRTPALVVFDNRLVNNVPYGEPLLAWQVVMESKDAPADLSVIIDAKNGQLLHRGTSLRDAVSRRIYDCSHPSASSWSYCKLAYNDPNYPGYIFGRDEGGPLCGINPLPDARFNGTQDIDISYPHLQVAHDYFAAEPFLRNGANLQGGTGYQPYHQVTKTYLYSYMDNIWYSGGALCAGYLGLRGEIWLCARETNQEVTGHEFMHAIVAAEIGQNLTSTWEGRTLEENFGDMFGDQMGTHDWVWNAEPGIARRPLDDPEPLWYPSRLQSSNYYCGGDYNSYIHFNDTVMGHAEYLMAVGGDFNGCHIDPIGDENMQWLIYNFWISHATPTTSFNQFVAGLETVCQQIWGATNPEYCTGVMNALLATQIDQYTLCSGGAALPATCAATVFASGEDLQPTAEFEPGSSIYVNSQLGRPGRTNLTVHLLPHEESRANWSAILPGLLSTTVDVEDNPEEGTPGTFSVLLGSIEETGQYDILVDTDSDGVFKPWIDRVTTITVVPPAPEQTLATVRPNLTPSSLFAQHEFVWALGTGYQAETAYNVYLMVHEEDRQEGSSLNAMFGTALSLTTDASGQIAAQVWMTDHTGTFDLAVDGNGDGLYQSASDKLVIFEVKDPIDGDGLCYQGQDWTTAENCHDAPADCGCQKPAECISLFMPMDPDPRWTCY